ncbi:MAG: hypothetical protein ACR2PS_14755 [Pseudomonadales bacterium]
MRNQLIALIGILGILLFSGSSLAADAESMVNAPGIYTLTNLHPDVENRRLYSTNYQMAYLMPVCSEVEITKLSKKKMKFRDKKSGAEYTYLWHKKSTPSGLNSHIEKHFGTDCPRSEIAGLSKVDQEGITQGRPSNGMTRRGILIAMGYPPEHATPSLDQNLWMYWRNKFGKRSVRFGSDGKVDEVR